MYVQDIYRVGGPTPRFLTSTRFQPDGMRGNHPHTTTSHKFALLQINNALLRN